MTESSSCIFCKIASGNTPCHKIWEDENHMAFLSIFPNTDGFSVVIPKSHYPSYAFNLEDSQFIGLCIAAKKVGRLLDSAFDDVGRTGMIFEGFGVDHVHAKLFPMHGTSKNGKWSEVKSDNKIFFDKYLGYISSHDYHRADDNRLAGIAATIRSFVREA